MFAIYTPNGRIFSGPLEELYRVQKPKVSEKARSFEEFDEFSPILEKHYKPPTKAINAYKGLISKPDNKELICHAYQIMTSPVEVITDSDLLTTVIQKFRQFRYQDFPVINSQRQLIGILSRQQLYEYILKHGAVANKAKSVAELFINDQSKVYTAEPVTDIRRIASVQIKNKLHTIPILESDGQIVGIISRTDIIKAVIMDPPVSLWC